MPNGGWRLGGGSEAGEGCFPCVTPFGDEADDRGTCLSWRLLNFPESRHGGVLGERRIEAPGLANASALSSVREEGPTYKSRGQQVA